MIPTTKITDPDEALELVQKQREEVAERLEGWRALMASLRDFQRENNFAPRMRAAYSREGQ